MADFAKARGFRAYLFKLAEASLILSVTEMLPRDCSFWQYIAHCDIRLVGHKRVRKIEALPVKDENVTNASQYLRKNGANRPIRCKLVLLTNKKSYTGFPLRLKSVTLNDLERRSKPLSTIIPVLLHIALRCLRLNYRRI